MSSQRAFDHLQPSVQPMLGFSSVEHAAVETTCQAKQSFMEEPQDSFDQDVAQVNPIGEHNAIDLFLKEEDFFGTSLEDTSLEQNTPTALVTNQQLVLPASPGFRIPGTSAAAVGSIQETPTIEPIPVSVSAFHASTLNMFQQQQQGSNGDRVDENEQPKPRRALTSYNIFFQMERKVLLKNLPVKSKKKPRNSHGKIGFADMARTIAAKWKTIGPEDKKQYDALAALDKQRYQQEMAAWKLGQSGDSEGVVARQVSNGSVENPYIALPAQQATNNFVWPNRRPQTQQGNWPLPLDQQHNPNAFLPS